MSEADAEVHVVDDLTPEQSAAVSEFCAFTGKSPRREPKHVTHCSACV